MSNDVFTESPEGIESDAGGQVQVTEHHLPKDLYYVRIAVALAVVTALEVAVSYLDLPSAIELTILLVLMAIKFVVVASNFMHLKFDDKLLTRIFYAGLFTAVAVYLIALTSLQVFAAGG
jgi:cytochrome c oxidase subunit IV